MNMKKAMNWERPSIRIVKRMIEVKQGSSSIYMTKNDVNVLRMLGEGRYDGTYLAQTYPRTRYTIMNDGGIMATCKDESHNAVVYLSPKTIKLVTQFRDNNRPKLAWDRDILKRRF